MINNIIALDAWFRGEVIGFNSTVLTKFFFIITQFGSVPVAVIIFLATSLFLYRQHSNLLKFYVSFFAASELVVWLMKNFVDRTRPVGAVLYGEHSGSMPSGHAAAAIFLYGFICFLLAHFYSQAKSQKSWIAFFSFLIIFIGFSRLYLDVHFLSDVLVGYAIGGSFLTALIFLISHSKNG